MNCVTGVHKDGGKMKYIYGSYIKKIILFFLVILFFIGCDFNKSPSPYVFNGTYKLILVPVPEGGIYFPIGMRDNDTARVEKSFYIGETHVTYALWDTVARWAIEKDVGQYYGFFHNHHDYADSWKEIGKNVPITVGPYGEGKTSDGSVIDIEPFHVIPVWCNAFTEWYNYKHGTNLVPVYQDSYGNPIRYINNYDNFFNSANSDASGFRLPSQEEWELAARWNGDITVNTVTKVINGINFSAQPIKFIKGNSASGTEANNTSENNRVAIYSGNVGDNLNPRDVKTKAPNFLGIYDMSGNVLDQTSSFQPLGKGGQIHAISKGGHMESNSSEIAIGNYYTVWVYSPITGIQPSKYNGFRVVRNKD